MRIIYSDEAGVGDEIIEPITVVAATIVQADQQWGRIETDIKNIISDLVLERDRDTFEFKASKLFAQLSKGNNEQILRRFLSIFNDHKLPIAVGAIDRLSLKESMKKESQKNLTQSVGQTTAFLICAAFVEQTFMSYFPSEKGLWIADETRSKMPMKASLRRYQKFTAMIDVPATHFDHIIDTVYFGDSRESRGIQLADACNFFVKKHLMKSLPAERFYEIIKGRIVGGEPDIISLNQSN